MIRHRSTPPSVDAAALPSGYAEHEPSPVLAEVVECFWTSVASDSGAAYRHRVLPDGCLDVIVNLGDPWRAVDAPGEVVSDRAYVVGAMTRPLLLERGPRTHFLGVRFRPGVASALVPIAASELTDRRIPLDVLWREANDLVSRVAEAKTPKDQVRALEQCLIERGGERRAPPPTLRAAIKLILDSGGSISIDVLSRSVGRSRQQLARTFAHHVGLSPKMLCRVMRARRAMSRLRRERGAASSAVACDLGFYDQAHLASELKALTGLTPGEWQGAP